MHYVHTTSNNHKYLPVTFDDIQKTQYGIISETTQQKLGSQNLRP